MSDKIDEGLEAMAKVAGAAIALVQAMRLSPAQSHDFDNLLPKPWKDFLDAADRYAALADPDAARRNRDEHGPDIPTEGLDWRNKL